MNFQGKQAICEICGYPRGHGFDHTRCSGIRKQRGLSKTHRSAKKRTLRQLDYLVKTCTKYD